MALKPTSLTFPSETIGVTSPAQPVMLTVVGGNTALSISSIATQGDFAQTNNCPKFRSLLGQAAPSMSLSHQPQRARATAAS